MGFTIAFRYTEPGPEPEILPNTVIVTFNEDLSELMQAFNVPQTVTLIRGNEDDDHPLYISDSLSAGNRFIIVSKYTDETNNWFVSIDDGAYLLTKTVRK